MKRVFILLFVLSALALHGKDFHDMCNNNSAAPLVSDYSGQFAVLSFIENKGQVMDQYHNPRPDIQFRIAAASGLNIFIGAGTIHYQFSKTATSPSPTEPVSKDSYSMSRIDVEFLGANKNAKVITGEKQDYFENHIIPDIQNHGAIARAFNKITYQDIYPHIDWVCYINNGGLEHEFVIKEGGNIKDIKLKYSGAEKLTLHDDGSIAATTSLGNIIEHAPLCYQQDGKTINSRFELNNKILTYETGCYSRTLIIDPSLEWATYYGGSGDDYGNGITTDASGNVYITGWTNSTSAIATTGAYEATYEGGAFDAFLAKFNSAGAIQWATYFGGSGIDVGASVATDTADNVYITGWTNSTSGITTTGAYQPVFSVGATFNAFLAKFNSSGGIQWATYYGGSGDNEGKGVKTDSSGNVFITGWTNSLSGITTTGAYQGVYGGGAYDAFLAKFNSAGAIQWGTYYGGSGEEVEDGIAVDGPGNIYITGYTPSASGIATPGAYQTVEADGGLYSDVFLAKFNTAGAIQWATYYGGSGSDYGQGIATDNLDNVYVTGFTNSTSAIATPGAYRDTFGGGAYDVFLVKFSSAGAIQYGTYYGGTDVDYGQGVATDDSGNAYITGYTASASGIATTNGWDTAYGGSNDAFIAKFDSNGVIRSGTYYGGSGNDEGSGITTNGTGDVYITGRTTSAAGIATSGVYQAVYGGGDDAFLAKFSFCTLPDAGVITGIDSTCIDSTIMLSDAAPGGIWSSSDTDKAVVTAGVVWAKRTGADTVKYTVSNACGTETAEKTVFIRNNCTAGIKDLLPPLHDIVLYPNPAQNELTITSCYKITDLRISNMLGQVIYIRTPYAENVPVAISGFPAGIYFVKINGSAMSRFVKQ